jgi:hypothetical protein
MKGQSAFEFLVYVGILVLIMAVFMWNSMSLQNQSMHTKIDVEAKNLCNMVASEINNAVRTGDGYSRKFLVSKSFAGITDFTIKVSEYSVFLDWGDRSLICSIIIRNITNTDVIDKGYNFIENKNGNIYVSSV